MIKCHEDSQVLDDELQASCRRLDQYNVSTLGDGRSPTHQHNTKPPKNAGVLLKLETVVSVSKYL